MVNEEAVNERTKQNPLARLVQDIFATREDEIQCREAEGMIVRSAGELLSDEESQRQYPALWHHFRFCGDCAEEYRMAVELARMEAQGELVWPDRVPPPPGPAEAKSWPLRKSAVKFVFPGFSPALTQAVRRGEELLVEPLEVTLEEGDLQISFDLAVSEQDTGLRDLFCSVWADEGVVRAIFEGAPVWLQEGDEGPVVREEALDELGDVSFYNLVPGKYVLRLHLSGQEYVVREILLPGQS